MTAPPDLVAVPRHIDTVEACRRIKAALRARSGRAWSVRRGRGTSACWVHIDAPPERRVWHRLEDGLDERGFPRYRYVEDASRPGETGPVDRALLADLLGIDERFTCGGCSIVPSHVASYVSRAEGRGPTDEPPRDWD